MTGAPRKENGEIDWDKLPYGSEDVYNAAIEDAAKIALNTVSDNMDTCSGRDIIFIEDARTIEYKIKELKQ